MTDKKNKNIFIVAIVAFIMLAGVGIVFLTTRDEEVVLLEEKKIVDVSKDKQQMMKLVQTNNKDINRLVETNLHYIQNNVNAYDEDIEVDSDAIMVNNKQMMSIVFYTKEGEEYRHLFGTMVIDLDKQEVLFLDDLIKREQLPSLSMLVREQLALNQDLKFSKDTYYNTVPLLTNFNNIFVVEDGIEIWFREGHFPNQKVLKVKVLDEVINPYLNKSYIKRYDKQYDSEDIEPLRYIDPHKPMIAMTFDDGPTWENSEEIASFFYENKSAITYFFLGVEINKKPEIVKNVYALGHEVGSHSYGHPNLKKKDVNMEHEIDEVANMIREITGQSTVLYRPPYGSFNDEIVQRINSPVILWNVDSLDWKLKDTEKIVAETKPDMKDGKIVLMHDIYPESVEAAKILYNEYKDELQFVTITELMQYKGIPLNSGEVYFGGR